MKVEKNTEQERISCSLRVCRSEKSRESNKHDEVDVGEGKVYEDRNV